MPPIAVSRRALFALGLSVAAGCGRPDDAAAEPFRLSIRQLTQGPAHHYFGYIGHVQNIPWNGSGRWIAGLRVGFQDRMPGPADAAEIVLLDVHNEYAVRPVAHSLGWNPQQGTMLYWNPDARDTQLFFNDRDAATGKVFCALLDVERGERLREYRFDDAPVGNGGVSQAGGRFAAINYARMARLRLVTGYPGAWDWTEGVAAPADDGVFIVDIASGERRLAASFEQLRDFLAPRHPRIVDTPLFINHTLWNRDGDRLFFFVRGNFADRENRINVPVTMWADGSGLTEQRVFIGGHPEWELGARMIGAVGDDLVLYDTDRQEIVETLGTREIFPQAGGDTALSPDAGWIVNGSTEGSSYVYTVLRRSDGAWRRTPPLNRTGFESGDLRLDPAPCWNRTSDRILFPGLAEDGTRQMFLLQVES